MRKIIVVALLLMIVASVAACGGAAQPTATPAQPTSAPTVASKGDAVAGKNSYAVACVACHGPNGEGVTGLGKSWVTSQFIKSQTDDQLVEFIKKGRPASDPSNTTGVEMPAKGGNPGLTDQDLYNLVAYMRTVNKP